MTVVSTKEFNSNQKKYFDMAIDEHVVIKRGENMFHLTCSNYNNLDEYDEVLEPDDDLQNAITMDELLERTYKVINKFFADKNESISNTKGA